MSEEESETFAVWTVLGILAVLVLVLGVGFVLGYNFRYVTGTAKCELEGVTCFDYKDTKLMRLDDFERDVSCYTFNEINISCVRR